MKSWLCPSSCYDLWNVKKMLLWSKITKPIKLKSCNLQCKCNLCKILIKHIIHYPPPLHKRKERRIWNQNCLQYVLQSKYHRDCLVLVHMLPKLHHKAERLVLFCFFSFLFQFENCIPFRRSYCRTNSSIIYNRNNWGHNYLMFHLLPTNKKH